MNKNVLRGNWMQLRGSVKREWGRLTDDDLAIVQGEYDRLLGVIQKRYGVARDQATKELEDFLSRFTGEIGQ